MNANNICSIHNNYKYILAYTIYNIMHMGKFNYYDKYTDPSQGSFTVSFHFLPRHQ